MTHPTAYLCKTLERPVSTGALSLFNFADMKDEITEDDPIIIASTENDPADSLDFLGESARTAEFVSADYRAGDGEAGTLSQSGVLQMSPG